MQVEFGEYKTTYRAKELIAQVLNSNWLTLGPMVDRWETLWKETFGYPYVRAINSGTSANFTCGLAIRELKGLGNIIVPALSFIASASPFVCAGFDLRFVDVDTDMNMDPDLVEEQIDKDTKAIVVVNLMGTPAKLDRFREIADKHNLILIIDNCESYG